MTKNSEINVKITKNEISLFKFLLFFIFLFFCTNHLFSQDSIPEKKDLTEEKTMQFQEFFFKALSEKSIENYQKAIENLESCNQILENQVAVFFEFSKNYLFLNNTALAKEYIERALLKESKNLWMLKHLVSIHERDLNFSEALKIQEKIVAINPKQRESLVRLYFLNNQFKEVLSLLDVLEVEGSISSDLKLFRDRLKKSKQPEIKEVILTDFDGLKLQFKTDKSYKILEEILQKSETTPDSLLKYSNEGIALFPSQPFLYLQNGKALNHLKEFKKALLSLKSGLDFVIDEKMEAVFYDEIARAYNGLGNTVEEKKYLQKATNLKS